MSGHDFFVEQGGASLDLNSVQPKPFGWMLDVVWLNLVELSNHELFTQLLERVILITSL